jgi:hypothetical protein
MNTRDVLNANLYPGGYDNALRKSFPYYDSLTITAGQTEYYFFNTALGNAFLRNKKLPLAGSEVFFNEEISAYLDLKISTLAQANALNELLQQSYLLITVDNRVVCKLPGLDFIQYVFGDTFIATATAVQPRAHLAKRKLPLPIILNSTSSFEFKLVIPTTAATSFDANVFHLVLHGTQIDKLSSFYWDNLKRNEFQEVPVTYYYTTPITGAAQNVYEMFADPAANNLLYSQNFPLSDIVTFALQNIEVYVNQPDTAIEPSTIFFSRLQNLLYINIDDREYYNSNLQDMLSMFAGFGVSLTTTPDTAVVNFMSIRQSKTFPVPLMFPANSKVRITLTQPAASLGITGEITVAMRGIETRRVA